MSTESEQEEFIEVQIVEVSSEPIELYKVLKIANMVGGGGEAKIVISEGYVYLNNELEYQKRKKVYHGDYVAFNGNVYQVHVVEPEYLEPEEQTVTQTPATSVKKQPQKQSKNKKQKTQNKGSKNTKSENAKIEAGKRKPISF